MKEIEKKEIKDILSIADSLPADFFTNPEHDKRLDDAIEATTGLVYALDDEGERMAKADSTAINKFATTYDKFIAAVYKFQTEEIGAWRTAKKIKTKQLLDNRQALIDQFAEGRNRKLDDITKILVAALEVKWLEHGVKKEFQNGNIQPIVSLAGTLTPKGALTKKATDFIDAIVAANLAEQRRIEARHMLIENRCLREDLNPPLTFAHMGESFTADDETFNAKLDFLILTEKERKAEMELRIKKQQEAENQRKLDAALKEQQAEADRIAREKMQEEKRVIAEQKRQTEVRFAALDRANNAKLEEIMQVPQPRRDRAAELREKAAHIEQAAHRADRNADRQRELDQAAKLRQQADELETPNPGKRTVMITATFAFAGISERVSNAGVEKFFAEQLSEKMQSILVSTKSRNA